MNPCSRLPRRNPCLLPSRDTLAVSALLLPGISMMCLASVLDPMRAANRVTGRSLFEWRLLSPDGAPVPTTCGLQVAVDGRFGTHSATPLLLVVAGFDAQVHASRATLRSLAHSAGRAELVVAVEAGSWLLARAGLLDGHRATTHWEDLEDLAARHPRVRVCPDRYVVDGRWASAAAASPAFDFMLHLIGSRSGPSVAMDVAGVFGYQPSRSGSEAQPQVSLGRLERQEPRVARAIRFMEQHLDSPPPMARIAHHVGTTPRTLEKLFAAWVGTSPARYFLGLRLGAARRLVVDTRLAMTEIALRTGFGSASDFSRAFRRHFERAPASLRRSAR